MRVIHGLTLVIATGIASAPSIAAADRLWTSVGNGCVPVDEDIAVDNYDSRGFGVGFKGTATGDIRLTCPVTLRANGSTGSWQAVNMSYKDPDGTGTGSRIRADFRQVSDASNASSSLCVADSNTNSATGLTTWSCSFVPAFTPSTTKSYYVEITIERTTSALDPELLAVWLSGT